MNRNKFWINHADKQWAAREDEGPIFMSHARSMAIEDFSKMSINIAEHLELNKNDCLLDIGGSVGGISIELHCLVSQIKVIDPSRKMIEYGEELVKNKKINNISFAEAKLPALRNIESNTYSKIMCGGMVLNYINDNELRPSLINIKRIMKKGGKALFFHHYQGQVKPNTSLLFKYAMTNILGKISYYQIKEIAEEIGFKDIKKVYVPYADSFGALVSSKSFSFALSL